MATSLGLLVGFHVRRAFSWNLQTVSVADAERAALTTATIDDPTTQRYLAWRRSLLMCVIVPLAISAMLSTIDLAREDLAPFSSMGKTIRWADVGALWAMPLAALIALKSWTDPVLSHKRLILGWAIGFFIPIASSLVPLEALINLPPPANAQEAIDQATALAPFKLAYGVESYFKLMPLVLSLLPSVIRASVRIKTLLPGSIVPGWFLMGAAPLNLLLWLVALIAVNHFAGNALLLAGVGLFIAAPLAYIRRGYLFVKPLAVPQEVAPIGAAQRTAITCVLAGLSLMVVYMLTKTIAGKHIIGFSEETSLIRPWNRDIYRFVFDYLARSLFMTALFADLLLRVNLTVHRDQKAFHEDPASSEYDALMKEVAAALPRAKPAPAAIKP